MTTQMHGPLTVVCHTVGFVSSVFREHSYSLLALVDVCLILFITLCYLSVNVRNGYMDSYSWVFQRAFANFSAHDMCIGCCQLYPTSMYTLEDSKGYAHRPA